MIGIVDEARVDQELFPEFVRHANDPPAGDYDYWHLSQRGTVLAALSVRGVPGAREAIDRLFIESRSKHPNEILGALDIIEVDGEQGLIQVCAVLGDEAYKNSSDTVSDWLLKNFDEGRGQGASLSALQAVRDHNPGVDRFLSAIEAEKETARARKDRLKLAETPSSDSVYASVPRNDRGLSAERVIEWIQNAPQIEGPYPSSVEGRGWLRGWGIKASEDSINQVIDALEATTSPIEQRRYLSVFSMRSMPRVSDRIVQLAEANDERVRSRAYAAFKNVSDLRIRDAAMRSLRGDFVKSGSLELFQSSYVRGDHEMIEDALVVPGDKDELHSVVFDVADICAKAKLTECLSLMLFVYEYSPCGNCRGKVVDTMVELDVIPRWVAEECRFDAMCDIRSNFGGPRLED